MNTPKRHRLRSLFAFAAKAAWDGPVFGVVTFSQSGSRGLIDPVINAYGVIGKYVGDKMTVLWPETARNRARAIKCGLAMLEATDAATSRYARSNGYAPRVRIGIHSGEVVAEELGDVSGEIACLGEAMNIAARLVEECCHFGRSTVVRAPVIELLPPTCNDEQLEAMGEI